jgi:hypothetical protein
MEHYHFVMYLQMLFLKILKLCGYTQVFVTSFLQVLLMLEFGTLKKALKSRDIATVFTTWTKLAQNRSSWRQLIGDTTAAPTGPTARDERAARRNLRNNAPA